MEYIQIETLLQDLNKTTKLNKVTNKEFQQNFICNAKNFERLLYNIIQIFNIDNITFNNIFHLDNNINKHNIYNIDNINDLFNELKKIYKNKFLTYNIDNLDNKDNLNFNSNYYSRIITNINKINNWNIIDIYSEKKSNEYFDYTFHNITKYISIQFKLNDSDNKFNLNILESDCDNIKLQIIVNFNCQEKSNIIKHKISNFILLIKKINGCLLMF
jgi:hypothetical protein